MKVFVIVEHYDRGSDEVAVRAVFDTRAKAEAYIAENFKGWREPTEEDDGGYDREGYYDDPTDTSSSDRVFIAEEEVK